MDARDEQLLDLIKGNARMSFQEIGDELGISRVAAMKRVRKLEEEGIIRGYNTCIYRDDEITMFMDLEIRPERYDKVIKYITTRTTFIRQIFRTTGESRMFFPIKCLNSSGEISPKPLKRVISAFAPHLRIASRRSCSV